MGIPEVGRMRVGMPSPSKSSFHISATIKLLAFLTSTHILLSSYLSSCSPLFLEGEGECFVGGASPLQTSLIYPARTASPR